MIVSETLMLVVKMQQKKEERKYVLVFDRENFKANYMNFPIVNIYEECWLGEDN